MKIENLIVASILGELPLADEIRVKEWFAQNKNNYIIYNQLQEIYTLILMRDASLSQDRIRKELHQYYRLNRGKKMIVKLSTATGVAVAVLFLSIFAYDLTKQENKFSAEYVFVADNKSPTVDSIVEQGVIKAYMITTEGVIQLEEDKVNLFKSNGMDGEVISKKIVYNTINVPEKNQFRLVLEDSTIVWLNGGSSLTYPVQFATEQREVLLSGEAYFEVKSHPQRPFVVKSKSVQSVVYGTKININAYKTSNYVSTTLFTGKVSVNGVAITPGEMAMKNDNSSDVVVSQVDLLVANSWMRGEFYFNGAKLETIMEQLSQWYGMEIVYENETVRNEIFTIAFSRKRELYYALKMLSGTNKIKFRIVNNKIVVNMK